MDKRTEGRADHQWFSEMPNATRYAADGMTSKKKGRIGRQKRQERKSEYITGLGGFCGLWRSELGAEYLVPEAACDAETVGVVGVVVLEVVFLELAVEGWKAVRGGC